MIDNVRNSNHQTIAESFNQFFAKIGSSLSSKVRTHQLPHFTTFLNRSIHCTFSFNTITSEDLVKLFSLCNPKATLDPDGISMKLLKNISHNICPALSFIIQQSLNTGIFPDHLKIAKVLPLYKKGDKFLFDNYRPISLLPCISKIFEKVVYNQLYEYFDQNKLFISEQHGFRKKHSTETATLEFVGRITAKIRILWDKRCSSIMVR